MLTYCPFYPVGWKSQRYVQPLCAQPLCAQPLCAQPLCSSGTARNRVRLPWKKPSPSFSAAVRNGNVLDRGTAVPVDEQGRLQVQYVPSRKMPDDLREIVGEVLALLLAQSAVQDDVIAVYARGSIVLGELMAGTSDLDLVVYCHDAQTVEAVKHARKRVSKSVSEKYGFSRLDCSTFVWRDSVLESNQFALTLQAFGVCVYGEDLIRQIPACKASSNAGANVLRDRRVTLEEAERCRRAGDRNGERRVFQWFFKRTLRASAELCAPQYKISVIARPEWETLFCQALTYACASASGWENLDAQSVARCASDLAVIVEDTYLRRNFRRITPESISFSLSVPADLLPKPRPYWGVVQAWQKRIECLLLDLRPRRPASSSPARKLLVDELPALRPMNLRTCRKGDSSPNAGIVDCLQLYDEPVLYRAAVSAEACSEAHLRYNVSSLSLSRRRALVRVSPCNVFVFCRTTHETISSGLFSPPSVTLTMEESEFAARCTEDMHSMPPIAYSSGKERVYMQSELSKEECLVETLMEDKGNLVMTQRERVWISTAGTVSALHYDASNSVLIQLVGQKRMLLFPPQSLLEQGIYPLGHPLHRRSRVDLTASRCCANEQLFSNFWQSPAVAKGVVEAVLSPGDICTFPAGYDSVELPQPAVSTG